MYFDGQIMYLYKWRFTEHKDYVWKTTSRKYLDWLNFGCIQHHKLFKDWWNMLNQMCSNADFNLSYFYRVLIFRFVSKYWSSNFIKLCLHTALKNYRLNKSLCIYGHVRYLYMYIGGSSHHVDACKKKTTTTSGDYLDIINF